MKRENRKNLAVAMGLLALFAVWTVAVRYIDVCPIGPRGSEVGFATLNGAFHRLTGVNMTLYTITDWLGLVPVGLALGFAMLGLARWITRKSVRKVDFSILVLGGFYLAVMAAYILFEEVVINYRPVLIDGRLEASYPSSTTMLVLCVMPTACMQLRQRLRNPKARGWLTSALTGFTAFMVIGRIFAGVHWITDIVGGALLSAGLVMLYRFVCGLEKRKEGV